MFSLAGKSCVVTGASRGLGRAIALAYAAQGADLVLTARSRNDLEQLRAEVESLGRRAVVRAGDVTDMAHLRAVGQEAVSAFGRLDVWVNNAGGDPSIAGGWAEWLDITEEGWDRMLRLNLKAQVFGAQAAARLMRDGGRGGSIIFLSSIDSLYAAPGGEGICGACKAATTQTSTDSVFSGRATQILQGNLSRPTQPLHLGREPWDDEQPRTEEYCSIEVNHRQGVSHTQPVLLAQGCREGQGPSPSDLDRHGRHTEIQYIRIPGGAPLHGL